MADINAFGLNAGKLKKVASTDKLIIAGNLEVKGTTLTLDAENVVVRDKSLRLGVPGGFKDATYAQSGTTVTVTSTGHGISNSTYLSIVDPATTPLIAEGTYLLTASDPNTFAFTGSQSVTTSAGTAIKHSASNVTTSTADGSGIIVSTASPTDISFKYVHSSTAWTTASIVDAASFLGDVTGDVTGNVTGDLTGNYTGNLTGNVTGNVTGDITGDLTGDVTGDITGDITGAHTGDITGAITGNITGALTGNVGGNITGNITGTHTGDITGAITGDITGAIGGDLTGDVTGDITGTHTGNMTGNITGDISGSVSGAISGTAAKATNMAGGGNATVVYQSTANNTAFLTAGSAGQHLTMNSGASAPEWTTPGSTATVTTTSGSVINTLFDAEEAIAIGQAVSVGTIDGKVKLATAATAAVDAVIGVAGAAVAAPVVSTHIDGTATNFVAAAAAKLVITCTNNGWAGNVADDETWTFSVDTDGNDATPEVHTITFASGSSGSGVAFAGNAVTIKKGQYTTAVTLIGALNTIFSAGEFLAASWTTALSNANQTLTITAPSTSNANFNFSAVDPTVGSPGEISASATNQSNEVLSSLQISIPNCVIATLNTKNFDFTVNHDGASAGQVFRLTFASGTLPGSSSGGFDTATPRAATIGISGLANDAAGREEIVDRILAVFVGEASADFDTDDWTTSEVSSTIFKITADAGAAAWDFSAVSPDTTTIDSYSKLSLCMPGSIVDISGASTLGESGVSRGAEVYLGSSGNLTTVAPTSNACIYRVGYITHSTNSAEKMLFSPQYIADV